MSHLLTQIDYIYRKLKIEEEFEQLVLNISSLKELRDLANPRNIKQISDDLPKEILSKLFTNDLNNIIPLISWNNNNVEIQFSLIRIYLKYFQKTKNYDSLNNINIDGKTMLFNIFRCCVMTFEGNFDNLFSGKLENRLIIK